IGSNLVRRLAGDGWSVHAVVRPGSDATALGEARGRVTLHTFDETTDSADQIVAAARPDIVFHLASLFLAQHAAKDVAPLMESNVRFGAQLLEAMARHDVRRLVNA